jgi:hypothetical protein
MQRMMNMRKIASGKSFLPVFKEVKKSSNNCKDELYKSYHIFNILLSFFQKFC